MTLHLVLRRLVAGASLTIACACGASNEPASAEEAPGVAPTGSDAGASGAGTDAADANGEAGSSDPLDTPQNFYFIAWRGAPGEALTYARQMGHRYVAYIPGMENEPLAKSDDVRFYFESPEFKVAPTSVEIDITATPTPEQMDFAEGKTCWRSNAAYPMNLATGWPRNDHIFTVVIDWQQQRVIDYFVERAVAEVKRIQAANPHMKFSGLAWDEADLHGSFQSHRYSRNSVGAGSVLDVTVKLAALAASGNSLGGMSQGDLIAEIQRVANGEVSLSDSRISELAFDPAVGPVIQQALPAFNANASFPVSVDYWTGNGSCLLHAGITHEYPTYTDGLAAFFKTIVARVRSDINAQAKWMIEPYKIYFEWGQFLEKRADAKDLVPDIMRQESGGLAFAEDKRIFASGMLGHDRVGVTAPNDFSEATNRAKAGVAAINGLWWNWFGRFGGSTDIPNYQSLTEVPARLKLVRMVPTWDNLANVALAQRSWDGTVYQSPNSFVSSSVIATRQPGTKKLFVALLARDATYNLRPGEKVQSVHTVDGLFVEVGDGASEITVQGGAIRANELTKLDAPNAAYIIGLE